MWQAAWERLVSGSDRAERDQLRNTDKTEPPADVWSQPRGVLPSQPSDNASKVQTCFFLCGQDLCNHGLVTEKKKKFSDFKCNGEICF